MRGVSSLRPHLLLLLVLCISRLPPGHCVVWKSCGPQASPLRVEDVGLTPEKPLRGHSMDFIIRASMAGNARPIPQGQLVATVYYMRMPVYTRKEDLCNYLPNGCPILPFDRVELKNTQALPAWAPTGSYSMRFEGRSPVSCGSSVEEKGVGAVKDEECVIVCVDVWFGMHSTKDQDEMEALIDEDEHHDDHLDPF
ncbi:hypothetical protein DUNSADRAFT_5904 [Dunaliella salina]|uniref:MD-2-related lipid-recognition domain-containing protein n=1 Tax=Dunaliella salina TaxID=3046 RepID=A0ABQ7GPD2_DUNSA|nr:hypothetical protein DUNSADRAFT_5904 [Dunaliella salina]|eukprot:KAF5836457.1 hypothetical protein DUNSADRAFT_5904 [Dunaliella salina]